MASTGPYSLPLYNLRVLVANSSTFQTWTSTANATAALARVYRTSIAESGIARPFAMVFHGNNWVFTDPATASEGNAYGTLGLLFEQTVGESYLADDAGGEEDFSNTTGGILEDMMDLQGRGGYLIVRRFRSVFGPERTKTSSTIDSYMAGFEVDWGIE